MPLSISNVFFCALSLLIASKLLSTRILGGRNGTKTTPLQGPPSKGFISPLDRSIDQSQDPTYIHEQWAIKYGSAFKVPRGLGSYKIMIVDPRAIAHFYSRETSGYVKTLITRIFIENIIGRGLLSAEGENHRRQRKALSPAFSNAAIRRITSVFYDSSYKLKTHWDSILDASSDSGVIIDVQNWMNHVSLDSIGIAGFGHDFGTLDGKYPAVVEVFDAMENSKRSLISSIVFLMAPVLPLLLKLPTSDNILFRRLHLAMHQIADELLVRMRKEKGGEMTEGTTEEKSMIGLLVKAENADSQLYMSRAEVLSQNALLLGGYETTSITLTWALIELSRHKEKQHKLRKELSRFSDATDPTWDELVSELPYLDSVVHEVLRLHPPAVELSRIAAEDDIIPFTTPFVTSTGEKLSSLTIKKGTIVSVPLGSINKSEAFWGPNAKDFEPERWIDNADIPAKKIQGHRHLLTFSDGPRICLGRNFALAETKAALSVLIRNYTFELPGGVETKIEMHRSVVLRPKVAGEEGVKVPLRVRRVE